MKAIGTLAAALALAAIAGTTAAQERSDERRREIPAAAPAGIVDALRARGAAMTALGRHGGLEGWFVELGRGEAYSLYVTPEGYAVAGPMYGPDGTLVTGGQLEAAGKTEVSDGLDGRPRRVASAGAAAPGVSKVPIRAKQAPSGAFGRSAAAFGFTLGDRGPLAVLIGDPGCSWSRSTVAALGRLALAGRFRLHVVPVGILGAASAKRAVRIASSPDPAQAWFGRGVAPAHRAGGHWIEANNAVFESWGEDAVPLIAWSGPRGGPVYAVGAVADPERWAREALGR